MATRDSKHGPPPTRRLAQVLGLRLVRSRIAPLLIATLLVVTLTVAFLLGPGPLLLLLAAVVLGAAIFWLWTALMTLRSDRPLSLDDTLAMVVPTAEDERKQAVLRALKDLEYELSVGKLSRADYQALVTQYRNEAKQLLFLIEQQQTESLSKAQTLWQKRLKWEGLASQEAPVDDAFPAKSREASS
ncbi:hypothetical protein ACFL5O_09445 [Myxococcota bacterium]